MVGPRQQKEVNLEKSFNLQFYVCMTQKNDKKKKVMEEKTTWE